MSVMSNKKSSLEAALCWLWQEVTTSTTPLSFVFILKCAGEIAYDIESDLVIIDEFAMVSKQET